MLTIRIVTSGLGLGNTLLKQADGFILIDMKGIVLCVIEMRLRDQRNIFLARYFINHPNSFKFSVFLIFIV